MRREKSQKRTLTALEQTSPESVYPGYGFVMGKARVKKLYNIGARVFDTLMRLWNAAVAAEAERELREFLRGNLDETMTILELGCGTARNLENIRSIDLKFKKYLGLDFSPSMLDVARSKFPDNPSVEFREQDTTTLDCIKEK